jgi:hypothetical protein
MSKIKTFTLYYSALFFIFKEYLLKLINNLPILSSVKRVVTIIFIISISWASKINACDKLLENFEQECALQDDYLILKKRFKKNHNVNIENITGYRAKRLINYKHWDSRKTDFACRPWLFYKPKPKAWINWESGNTFVKKIAQTESFKEHFSLSPYLLRAVHISSIDPDVIGQLAKLKGTSPGGFRTKFYQIPGFHVSCETVEVKKSNYQFLQNFDLKDDNGDPLVTSKLINCNSSGGGNSSHTTRSSANSKKKSVRSTDHYFGIVQYPNSDVVQSELKKLEKFVKESLEKIKAGKNDISPMELMADAQRWFVAIHPFGDGNGRTSRYVQDLFSHYFGLPFFRGGNLQDDVLISGMNYREKFKAEGKNLLNFLRKCETYYQRGISFEEMPCDCVPLYSYKKIDRPEKGEWKRKIVIDENGVECERKMFEYPDRAIESFDDVLMWMINNRIYKETDI